MKMPETARIVCLEASGGHGTRIDKFLFSQFPAYSRAYFQQLMERGFILVNQRSTKASYSVKNGDQIDITFKSKEYNLDPVEVDFEIIDETQDFIIVNKPAGLLVHNAPSAPEEVSLVNGLLHRFKDLAAIDDKERPGIVHRLDKNTSGLLIIARNRSAQAELSAMFKNRAVSKTYLALVHGIPPKKGSIDLPIGRHPTERHKMATFGIDTKPALTHFELLESYGDSAMIAAKIVTGRTHQIRVHCASMGHGLLGDETYGVSSALIARQALHAWKVSFEYHGKHFSYTVEPPADMKQAIATLNQKNTDNKILFI